MDNEEIKKLEIKTEGVKVYDPRIKKWIVSDNPALIFADMVTRQVFISKHNSNYLDDPQKFWDFISKFANYCDEEIGF